jgi:hypothetical protein
VETIDLSAGAVASEEKEGRTAVVMSMLGKRLTESGEHINEMHIPDYLAHGCLGIDLSDSAATVTPPLSQFQFLPTWQALQVATQVIHTSGEPAINSFATGAWRLLIASRSIAMPNSLDGACLESVQPTKVIVLLARLFALQAPKQDLSSGAMNVWRAVVPQADEEVTLSFLYTVLELSQRVMNARSEESL